MTHAKQRQLGLDHRGDVPSPHERRRLSVAALLDDRTVLRAYTDPASVRESTRLRLLQAAQQLGIRPPQFVGEDRGAEPREAS